MRFYRNLLALVSVIILGTVLTISTFVYFNVKEILTDRAAEKLTAIANLQKIRVENFNKLSMERMEQFTSRLLIKLILDRHNSGKSLDSDHEKGMTIMSETIKNTPIFTAVSLVSLKGEIVVSSDKSLLKKNIKETQIFTDGLKKVIIDRFYLKKEAGLNELMFNLATPLKLNGLVVGMALFEAKADFLSNITANNTDLGDTGEIILAIKQKQKAKFLTKTQFDKDAALKRQMNWDGGEDYISFAKQEKPVIKLDYRNREVISVVREIEGMNWSLIVKIDLDEVYDPIISFLRWMIIMAFIVIIVITTIARFMLKYITKPL